MHVSITALVFLVIGSIGLSAWTVWAIVCHAYEKMMKGVVGLPVASFEAWLAVAPPAVSEFIAFIGKRHYDRYYRGWFYALLFPFIFTLWIVVSIVMIHNSNA